MMTKTFWTIQLAGLLAVGIVAVTPIDATAQVILNNSGIREIPIYGAEWQATPWCDTWDNGPVNLHTNARETLPTAYRYVSFLGIRWRSSYYSVDADLYNGGWYDCAVDLKYDYWAPGQLSAGAGPGAEVVRSYYLPVGAGGTVRSGKIGSCVPGNGGDVTIDSRLNPSMLLHEPRDSWPVAAYYSCP